MANIGKMSGTSWHIEQIRRKKGSKNRKRIAGTYDPKTEGYYKKFKSDGELEMKYSQLGEYGVSY